VESRVLHVTTGRVILVALKIFCLLMPMDPIREPQSPGDCNSSSIYKIQAPLARERKAPLCEFELRPSGAWSHND
jgi:hypothetical protein